MTQPAKTTSREFGQALKNARESAGIPLDAIVARTKIGGRMLAAIEDGEFGRLPNQVFARIFVRQYLDFIGARPEDWLPAFDAAWRRFAESSQSLPIGPSLPMRKRRLGPWMTGLVLVAAGVAGVLVVERRQGPVAPENAEAPALAAAPQAPTAPPQPPAAPAEPASTVPIQPPPAPPLPPTTLVVKAVQGPCWVEVRIAGEKASSRLLAAGTAWEVPAGGKAIDVMLGDAGAASVAYLGEMRNPAGRPGEVVRIHLAGNAPVPAGP